MTAKQIDCSEEEDDTCTCHTGLSTMKASNVTKATKPKACNVVKASTNSFVTTTRSKMMDPNNTATTAPANAKHNNVASAADANQKVIIANEILLITTCLAQWAVLVGISTLASLDTFLAELHDLSSPDRNELHRRGAIGRLRLRWLNTAQLVWDDEVKKLFKLTGRFREALLWNKLKQGTDQQRLNGLVRQFQKTLNKVRTKTRVGDHHLAAFLQPQVDNRRQYAPPPKQLPLLAASQATQQLQYCTVDGGSPTTTRRGATELTSWGPTGGAEERTAP